MRIVLGVGVLVTAVVAGVAAQQAPRVDPERVLSERFQFSTAEIGQVRAGQPVVHVNADRDEIVGVGAIRLPGRKERLADWLKNVEHFRTSAELGVTHVMPMPVTAAGFAGLTLDAADVDELRQCTPERCGLRVTSDAAAKLQAIAWTAPDAAAKATDVIREMLVGYVTAYANGGIADEDMRQLTARATTLTAIAPEFIAYLAGYPKTTLPGVDQVFYWASMPGGSKTIVSVHHLTLFRRGAGEIWIADRNVYSSRYFDAAGTAIGLYDAPDGTGFYAVAGSRMKVSQLDSMGARLLRRQFEKSAADTVRMYLEWIRDSLAK